MTVRDLISELLDYEMDQEVEIRLSLNDETHEDDFEVTNDIAPFSGSSNKVYLEVGMLDQTLVDSEAYERMKDRLEELEEMT